MKLIALAAIAALTGCLDQAETPMPPPETEDRSVLESCGRPPLVPRWSYTIDPAKPDFAVVSMKDFIAHEAWVDAVSKWSICADNSQ